MPLFSMQVPNGGLHVVTVGENRHAYAQNGKQMDASACFSPNATTRPQRNRQARRDLGKDDKL